jgi:hypothetical protein
MIKGIAKYLPTYTTYTTIFLCSKSELEYNPDAGTCLSAFHAGFPVLVLDYPSSAPSAAACHVHTPAIVAVERPFGDSKGIHDFTI